MPVIFYLFLATNSKMFKDIDFAIGLREILSSVCVFVLFIYFFLLQC